MGRIANYVIGAVVGAVAAGGITYHKMDAQFTAFRTDPVRVEAAFEQAYDAKASITPDDKKLLNHTEEFAYGKLVQGIDPSAVRPGYENPANVRIRVFTSPEGTYAGLGSVRDMKVHPIRYEDGDLTCGEKKVAVAAGPKHDMWDDIWNKVEGAAQTAKDAVSGSIDKIVGQ